MSEKNLKTDWSAYLFPALFWNLIYTKPLLTMFKDNSTLILLLMSVVFFALLLYSLLIRRIGLIIDNGFLPIVFIFLVFSISYLFNYNNYLNVYLYQYLSRVFLLLFIFLTVSDLKLMLRNYCYLSYASIILYGFTPLIYQGFFTDYMDYGFTLALPAFLGIYISRKIFKFKYAIIFEIIVWILIISFSNRSVVLSAFGAILLYNIFIEKKSVKNSLKLLFGMITIGIIYYYLSTLMIWMKSLMNILNYNSYSINRFYDLIVNNRKVDLFSGREVILQSALDFISNNSIFGSGIGTFETLHSVYSHNIIVDFLLYWGIFGIILLLGVLIIGISSLRTKNNEEKIVVFLFLSIWFPKLLFSSSFLIEPAFWLFLSLSLRCFGRRKIRLKI